MFRIKIALFIKYKSLGRLWNFDGKLKTSSWSCAYHRPMRKYSPQPFWGPPPAPLGELRDARWKIVIIKHGKCLCFHFCQSACAIRRDRPRGRGRRRGFICTAVGALRLAMPLRNKVQRLGVLQAWSHELRGFKKRSDFHCTDASLSELPPPSPPTLYTHPYPRARFTVTTSFLPQKLRNDFVARMHCVALRCMTGVG